MVPAPTDVVSDTVCEKNQTAAVRRHVASNRTPRRKLCRRLTEAVQRMRSVLTSCAEDTSDIHVPLSIHVPLCVSLVLLTGYVLLGALLFGLWEPEWGVLVGSYFCFVTLSTIGFGDVVPGTSRDEWSSTPKQVLCSLYVVCGLALLAMCFELMQDQVKQVFRDVGRRLGLVEQPQPTAQVPADDDDVT